MVWPGFLLRRACRAKIHLIQHPRQSFVLVEEVEQQLEQPLVP